MPACEVNFQQCKATQGFTIARTATGASSTSAPGGEHHRHLRGLDVLLRRRRLLRMITPMGRRTADLTINGIRRPSHRERDGGADGDQGSAIARKGSEERREGGMTGDY
jgi:hypothetical protein